MKGGSNYAWQTVKLPPFFSSTLGAPSNGNCHFCTRRPSKFIFHEIPSLKHNLVCKTHNYTPKWHLKAFSPRYPFSTENLYRAHFIYSHNWYRFDTYLINSPMQVHYSILSYELKSWYKATIRVLGTFCVAYPHAVPFCFLPFWFYMKSF